jgi:hypothetical protein
LIGFTGSDTMECEMCGKDIGARPKNIIILHRAEGILLVPTCGSAKCKEKIGIWLAFGTVPTAEQIERIFQIIDKPRVKS